MTDASDQRPPVDNPLDPGRLASLGVEVLPHTPSTNAVLAERAREGAPEGLVVATEHQTAGRGRLDRTWETPAGSALTFSTLLRPEVPPATWPWLPLLTGYAVAKALAGAGFGAVLKWPNDVLIGDRKVAGILVERVETPGGPAAVVGIGLNVLLAAEELPVPTAGKTGTTNDAKDVWFIGFTSNVVAGGYIGYDDPQPLGRGASGGGFCGPVFQRFMSEAIKEYGGGKFKIPPGGHFINIDRYTGARLPDGATGENVVAEYFRDGEEPIFGVSFDGGFAMGSDLPLFDEAGGGGARQVTTSSGKKAVVGPKASFGTLSSGGLY